MGRNVEFGVVYCRCCFLFFVFTLAFIQFQTLKKLVTSKQTRLQKYGWRLLNVQLERIVGLNKKRPDQWWGILDSMLEHGTGIKNNEVAEVAIISFLILEQSQFKKETVYKYRKHYPKTKRNVEDIRNEFFSEVEKHIQEYKDEAQKAVATLDMFSLLSETTDEEKDDQSENESVGSIDPYDDVEFALHTVTVQTVQGTYDTFNIKEKYGDLDVVNAALRYLGCSADRKQLVSLNEEINLVVDNCAWTPEIFALFAKHVYGTLARPWSTYYESVRIAADILEVNRRDIMDVPYMEDPKAYLKERIDGYKNLITNDVTSVKDKCKLIQEMYAPFGTPEVENDAMLFDALLELINPLFLEELKSGNYSLVVSEVCITLARIVQYHVSRFEGFGAQYYEHLYRLMANDQSIVSFHACSQAAFIIGKLVEFLSEENAIKMTKKLVQCMGYGDGNKYQIEVMKTLVASVMVNVPIQKQDDDQQKILKMWNECKKLIYDGLQSKYNEIKRYSAVCIAYLYEIDYMNFKEIDNENIPNHVLSEIEEIVKNASWESIFDVKVETDDVLLREYGWNDLSKQELIERKELLMKWHEMEIKSNNAVGMAAVVQLIKTITRATRDTNRVGTRELPLQSGLSNNLQPQQNGATGGSNALTLENLNRLQQSFQGAEQEDDAKST